VNKYFVSKSKSEKICYKISKNLSLLESYSIEESSEETMRASWALGD
jgi:hypothetical protein